MVLKVTTETLSVGPGHPLTNTAYFPNPLAGLSSDIRENSFGRRMPTQASAVSNNKEEEPKEASDALVPRFPFLGNPRAHRPQPSLAAAAACLPLIG